jgi:hypothetical protein
VVCVQYNLFVLQQGLLCAAAQRHTWCLWLLWQCCKDIFVRLTNPADADTCCVLLCPTAVCARYGKDIADKSTLLTTLRTNKAYANLTHPMKATPSGKWVPDFMHR